MLSYGNMSIRREGEEMCSVQLRYYAMNQVLTGALNCNSNDKNLSESDFLSNVPMRQPKQIRQSKKFKDKCLTSIQNCEHIWKPGTWNIHNYTWKWKISKENSCIPTIRKNEEKFVTNLWRNGECKLIHYWIAWSMDKAWSYFVYCAIVLRFFGQPMI